MKQTAVAYPIQGLVKYHGLVDPVRRIPFHGSISVCTAPTRTRTTVESGRDVARDEVTIDGEVVSGRALERASAVLDAARAVAGQEDAGFRVASESNFPKYVGLGSSASGFAALATAACAALELPLDPGEVSEIARMGAGSACRAVTGGFSEWITRGPRSFGRRLAGPGELDWSTVALVVRHDVPTEGIHTQVRSSPFFRPRVELMEASLEAVRLALRAKDAVAVMEAAERDTLNLHAVTMTSKPGLVAWRGVTVEAMHRVRRLREEGVPAYFSVDTGATTYVNTPARHRGRVREALSELTSDQVSLMDLDVGPAAHVSDDHIF